MSSANGKVLEFFTKIPKLEANGSNWVIYKDCFFFAAAAASLLSHINGTGVKLTLALGFPRSGLLSELQQVVLDKYTSDLSWWQSDEAIIRQAICWRIWLVKTFGTLLSHIDHKQVEIICTYTRLRAGDSTVKEKKQPLIFLYTASYADAYLFQLIHPLYCYLN